MNYSITTIRVGATLEEPFVASCFLQYPAQCKSYGTDLDFIHIVIVEILKLNVTWIPYDNFDLLYKALEENQIDMIGNTQQLSLTSEKWFSTRAAYHLGVGFFIKSETTPKTLNPLKSFTWDLWLSLILLTCLVYIQGQLLVRIKYLQPSNAFYVLWFVILMIIMNLYANVLTGDLLTSTKKPVFNNMDELGEKLVSKQCRFVIWHNYLESNEMDEMASIFLPKHNLSWAKNFKVAFETNPPIQVKNKNDIFVYVKNNSCVIGLDFVSDKSLYDKLCGIEVKMMVDDIPAKQYGYFHNIKYLQSTFNEIFLTSPFTELPNVLFKQYFKRISANCSGSSDRSHYKLTVAKLINCFIIVTVGIIVAGTLMIMQIYLPSCTIVNKLTLKRNSFYWWKQNLNFKIV